MPGNSTYTCIPCRYSAKQTDLCPYCHQAMRCMGKAFKPPRKSNHSQWKKIELMVQHSQYFGYCKCCLRAKPRTLSEAKSLYKSRRSQNRHYSDVDRSIRDKQIARRLKWKGSL